MVDIEKRAFRLLLTKVANFIYTLLNDQTVLFLMIQFSINHFFAHSLVLFDS